MIAFALVAFLSAAPPPSFEVGGDLPKTGRLAVKDLKAMTPVNVTFAEKDGEHTFTAVPLIAILRSFGWDDGPAGKDVSPAAKHAGLNAVVIAFSADGYKSTFSVGELLETLGNAQVFVAWEMDGKPLPQDRGVFRILVTTDKKHSRAAYMLWKLEVKKL